MIKPLLARFSDALMLMPESKAVEFQGLITAFAESEHAERVMHGQSEVSASNDNDFWGEDGGDDAWLKKLLRPYNVVNGILQIPVRGVLLNNFPYQYFGYATGYAYIWQAFKRGMEDGNVKGVAFIIHSGGGEVAGNFDLVDRMVSYRGTKPIRAFAHEYAYSAAYNIAAVADPGGITVSRSGGVGSVGVITSHVDVSAMMDMIGQKITFITYGKYKADGNAYEALSEETLERMQARINVVGEEFVAMVAANRGLSPAAVKATQALTYPAKEAIEVGLADKIGPLDEALSAFEADLSQQPEDEQMTKTYSEDEYNAAVTSARTEGATSGKAEGIKEGHAAGVKLAQDRMNTVFGSDAGKERPKMAVKLLSNEKLANLDGESLVGLLGDHPAETASAPVADNTKADNANSFNAAMGKHKNNVGVDDKEDGESAEDKDAKNVLAMAAASGIPGF